MGVIANRRAYILAAILLTSYGCGESVSNEAADTAGPTPTNQSPTISGQPPASIIVGELYSFTPTASDPDNDPLTFSVSGAPRWAMFEPATGKIDGIPESGDVGMTGNIVITVSDGTDSSDLSGFAIDVQSAGTPPPPANQLPTISGQPPTSVIAGDMYSFTPTASDADNDPLTFLISGAPGWINFVSSTGMIEGTPGDGDVGTTGNIVISVSDGTGSSDLSGFTIDVQSNGTTPPPPNPSPDGYVGFGTKTEGADSCPTTPSDYHVTSLSGGSGQGTLRDAVSEDCRHIIFDVAGEISLGGLQITNSYLTIDGSTAPAPGITLVDIGTLRFEASNRIAVHDIIVNNIRSIGPSGDVEANDMWDLDGSSGAPIYNIILDHMTMHNGGDGSMDVYGEVYDITLSNNLIMDALEGHHFSESGSRRERLTVVGNVYARNNERQPRVRYNTTQLDFVNNVVYGWGWFEGGAAGFHINAGSGSPTANVENNVYLYVSGLDGSPNEALKIDDFGGSWHFEGNVWPDGETQGDSTSNSGRISMDGYEVERIPANQIDVSNAGTHFQTSEEQSLLSTIAQEIADVT